MKIKYLVIMGAACAVFGVVVSTQSVIAAPLAVAAAQLGDDAMIFSQPKLANQSAALITLYQAEVEDYRKKEREFSLAKAEYEQLQTLLALEKAVQSTQVVMLARTKVLITYLEMVRLAIDNSTGIDLPLKAGLQARLDQRVDQLRQHQQVVSTSDNRQAVAARADEFAQLNAPIRSETQLVLNTMALGKVQTLVDKIGILYADVKEYYKTNPGSAVASAQRARAYGQVDVIQQSLEIQLQAARTELDQQFAPQPGGRPPQSDTVTISQPYVLASQLLDYLRQLLVGES